MEEGERVVVTVLPILGEPTTPTKPADGAFDNPAHGFDHETLGMVGASDDFDHEARHGAGGAVLKDRTGIGAVREQLPEERELSEQG